MHDAQPDPQALEETERLLERVQRTQLPASGGRVTWDELRHAAGVTDDGIVWDDAGLAALALHAEASRPVPPQVAERHLSAMHEALDHVTVMPRRSSGLQWRRRLAGVTAAVTAFTTFGGGAVAMAQGAQPGDALYGVKRASEQVRLALELDAEGDAALHLQFAQRRLEEMQAAPEDAGELAEDALHGLAQAQEHGDPETQAAAQAAGANAVAVLEGLLAREDLPEQAAAAIEQARSRIEAHHAAHQSGDRGRDQAPGQQQDRPGRPGDGGTTGGQPDTRGAPDGTPGNRPDNAGQPARGS